MLHTSGSVCNLRLEMMRICLIFIDFADHDFSSYVWSLPASARPLLEQQLDWDNEGVDKDLIEIAHHMLDWEVKLCSHLGLTTIDVHDIKEKNSGKPELQR